MLKWLLGIVVAVAAALPAPLGSPVLHAAQAPAITVATYNICKRTCGSGRYDWRHRRSAVARSIAASGADVVAVQEAAGTVRQVASRLRSRGYALVTTSTDGCGRGCTQDSFVFVRTSTVAPLGQGGTTLSAISGLAWSGTFDRGWSWSYLVHRASGTRFLVASVHLPNGKNSAMEQLRRASAGGVVTTLRSNAAARGLAGIPTIIAGDLNSFSRRQPRGAQHVLKQAGFRDVHSAPDRRNAKVPTVNVTGRYRNPFPARPFRFRNPARLDYVMFDRGTPLHYEVFLRLRNGRFDDRYRGSDHNMVLGTVRLV